MLYIWQIKNGRVNDDSQFYRRMRWMRETFNVTKLLEAKTCRLDFILTNARFCVLSKIEIIEVISVGTLR